LDKTEAVTEVLVGALNASFINKSPLTTASPIIKEKSVLLLHNEYKKI
jgi:hypothetical protein